MNRKLFFLPILTCLILPSCSGNNNYVSPKGMPDYSIYHETNKMRISGWIAPYHGNFNGYNNKNMISQKSYDYLKDCGFNAIYAMYEYAVEHEQAILDSLDYAYNAGINYYAKSGKIFSWDKNVTPLEPGYFSTDYLISKYKNHPAFKGHLVCDEPNMVYYDALKARKEFYEQELPGKEFYVNLFPCYATDEQLGTSSYEEYVSSYIDKVNPEVLSFDHYSLSNDGGLPHCKPDSLYNREVVAYLCSQKNIPYMNFSLVSSSQYEKRPMFSEADISWQVMTDLAYGTSGVQYFCVYPVIEGNFRNALFDEDGEPTVFYNYAKNINEAALFMDEAYLSYKWVGTITNKGTEYSEEIGIPTFEYCKHSINSYDVLRKVTSNYNTLVGCFESKVDNYRGYMVTNFEDPADERVDEVTLKFSNTNKALIYHKASKEVVTLNNGVLNLNIEPGDGMFVIPFND